MTKYYVNGIYALPFFKLQPIINFPYRNKITEKSINQSNEVESPAKHIWMVYILS